MEQKVRSRLGTRPSRRHYAAATVAIVLVLLPTFVMVDTVPAQGSGRTGDFCVETVGGNSCTANDTGIEDLTIVQLINGCTEAPAGQFTAVFEVVLNASGAQNRYDLGFYIDLSGTPEGAASGTNCYHDYLDGTQTTDYTTQGPTWPPVSPYGDYDNNGVPDLYNRPWYDNDTDECGDIASGSQAIKTLVQLTLPCVDYDGDGYVDVHACASWRQNSQGACTSVAQALPGTGSKCGCRATTMMGVPTAVGLIAFDATDAGHGILLTWQTATEIDNLGFNLYRSESYDGMRVRLNDDLIRGQPPGSLEGGSYQFLDSTVPSQGVDYYYWLEDVDIRGETRLQGPISSASSAQGVTLYRVFVPWMAW